MVLISTSCKVSNHGFHVHLLGLLQIKVCWVLLLLGVPIEAQINIARPTVHTEQPSLANLHSSPKPFISNFTLPLPTLSNPNLSPNLPTSNNLHHQLFAGPPITAIRRRPPPSSIVFNYKFMERFFKRKLSTDNPSPSNPGSSNARPIEVDEILANLQADPGLRTRMADYSPNIRDEIRRAYLQKGPCQPRSYKFPQTNQSGINRRFIANWFDDHDWLEYSIAKDAAFCFHCYLFKSNFDQVGGDAFTGVGFNNWKKAKERFNLHVGPVGSVHNQAREVAYNLMHQTTHIETIVIKQTSQARTAYRTCLNASLKCTRYLLRQGLSFRGHDESAQSSNRGNYLELLQFLADHDEKVKAVVLENAPGNLKLIAPSIQKDLVNSCAKETIGLILSDVKR
ncbi:unnamed protein product [Prunus armeniaca]